MRKMIAVMQRTVIAKFWMMLKKAANPARPANGETDIVF